MVSNQSFLQVGTKKLEWKSSPFIMGILNVTPDSFSDGGAFSDTHLAVAHAKEMLMQGATMIDVGGESTRPGSDRISASEELSRVIPVIKALADEGMMISIDTYKAEVAAAAIQAGAQLINDISGLSFDPEMAMVAAEYQVPIIIMHTLGDPKTMQSGEIVYNDVVADIKEVLEQRIDLALQAGVRQEQIIIDPGIGFGKLLNHNLELTYRLHEFTTLGYPVLYGPSRKAFIGQLIGVDPALRDNATAIVCGYAVQQKVNILRVHNVALTMQAVTIMKAICNV